jgi:hypothetical protein
MKTEEWKFGYMRENVVYLFDNNKIGSFPILGGHFLENVKIEIKDTRLRIVGEEHIYNYYWRETYRNKWIAEPREEYIRKRKKWLLFGPKIEYLESWVEQKELSPFDCSLEGNWILKRINQYNTNRG